MEWSVVVLVVLFIAVCYRLWTHHLAPYRDPRHSTELHEKSPGLTYFRNRQGLWIYTHRVLPPAGVTVRGRIFSAHGFGGHSQRNYELQQHCAKLGFAWFANDHQGFGRSEGDRGYVERFNHYVDDFEQFIAYINAEYPDYSDLPTFFVGASMGGAIGIELMNRINGVGFNGALLLAPAIKPDPVIAAGWMVVLAGFLSKWFPRIAPISMKPGRGCSVPDAVREYTADPLVYAHPNGMRARWGQEMLDTMMHIMATVDKVTWPYVIYQGTADMVTNMSGVTYFHDNAPSKDKTVKYLEGWWHFFFNDTATTEIYTMMTDWMAQRL
eukprot:TRINITY_DN1463_c0_g2_i1.p1 TRINITY_DN1463_c0_g2~~TRINITY_DN1463_c0_g2_i1.p1  ORF type:complete len:325 (-),score=36.06 TRINITY_DN1463_c0_g2_i1:19-993(-)